MTHVRSILLISLCGIAFSCKHGVYLTVVEPPVVFVSTDVLAVAVVNRSFSDGTAKVVDIIDATLSGEGPNLDAEGSKASVTGCLEELGAMGRFERVVEVDSMTTEKPLPDVFPQQLTWEEVDAICSANNVQILFSLETYDSDTKLNYSTRTVNIAGPLGTQIPALEHHVQMTTNIVQGWRIYLPGANLVIDQFFIGDTYHNTSVGINPIKAAEGLMNRKQVVRQISANTGHRYASRIREVSFREYRRYYKKGSAGIRTGHRKARAGDWVGAGESWKKETDSARRKTAGRACHNMAIIEEINGNLEGAIKWAQQAYGEYGTKEALTYSRILLDRKARIDRMKQMSEYDSQD